MVTYKNTENFTGSEDLGRWTIAAFDNQTVVMMRRRDEKSVSIINYHGEGKTYVVLQTRTCKGGYSPV